MISKHLKVWFPHRNWSCDRPEVANDFLVDIFRNSNSSFSKFTAVNSCIRFWIDALVLLQDSYTEDSSAFFLILAWILPSRPPSTTFFSQKCVSFSKSNVVCSIYRFCAALTENIAVRLCLLFFLISVRGDGILEAFVVCVIFLKIGWSSRGAFPLGWWFSLHPSPWFFWGRFRKESRRLCRSSRLSWEQMVEVKELVVLLDLAAPKNVVSKVGAMVFTTMVLWVEGWDKRINRDVLAYLAEVFMGLTEPSCCSSSWSWDRILTVTDAFRLRYSNFFIKAFFLEIVSDVNCSNCWIFSSWHSEGSWRRRMIKSLRFSSGSGRQKLSADGKTVLCNLCGPMLWCLETTFWVCPGAITFTEYKLLPFIRLKELLIVSCRCFLWGNSLRLKRVHSREAFSNTSVDKMTFAKVGVMFILTLGLRMGSVRLSTATPLWEEEVCVSLWILKCFHFWMSFGLLHFFPSDPFYSLLRFFKM